MYHNYYIAPGPKENWRVAFTRGGIWGLPESHRPAWESLQSEDVLFFYVESPCSRVVGYGRIQDTHYDRSPFFADDYGPVTKWPLRLRFQVVLPTGDPLAVPGVSVEDILKFPRLKRFERLLWPQQWEELLRRCDAALR
jgi:hypothetical protein